MPGRPIRAGAPRPAAGLRHWKEEVEMKANAHLLRELIENIRVAGMELARKRRELSALQNRRKAMHIALRDRLMAESARRGERSSATAASDEARAHPEYVACLDEIALKQFEVDAAEVRYVAARALFQAAVAAPDEAGLLVEPGDDGRRSAA
ncbi:MAG TPA: hypothetical protein VKZ58_11205 [Longimicrobiales bacterium]|nr:hypothetical protein [Longimicrobiales bacterium]